MPHRNAVIPESLESVKGLPTTVKLFRIPASSVWQVRAWFDGRMIKRSTKTDSKAEAIAAAKAFYNHLLLRQSQHQPLTASHSFERVANDLLAEDQKRVDRGERAATLVSDAKYIFEKDLVRFFRNYKIKDINFQIIQLYVDDLTKRNVGSNTIRNHFIYLRKILKHGWKLGYLDKLPIFPTISVQDNAREWFSVEQYKLLRETLVKEVGARPPKVYMPITDELRYLTTFTVNTFLRPPADIKDLRNRDITVVKNKKSSYLKIIAESKVNPSTVISMPAAVGVYEDLMKFNKALGFGAPDDYVFFPSLVNRKYAMQTMRLQFNHVLEKAGLKKTRSGVDRTLYSLRHTAIMFRLINSDVDLLTLARNCRTSVDMIERFYASHLTAEMNVEKLQSVRKSP